jgi:hypothetical protein
MSEPRSDKLVTLPLSLFHVMATCYYGSGPRCGEAPTHPAVGEGVTERDEVEQRSLADLGVVRVAPGVPRGVAARKAQRVAMEGNDDANR